MSEQPSENASAASSEFLSRIPAAAPVALLAGDKNLRIVFCNRVAADLLGTEAEKLIGQELVEIAPADSRDELLDKARQVVADGQTARAELQVSIADTPMHLAVVMSPLADAEGEVQGFCCRLSDFTSQRSMASRLAQSEKMAALGTLAGGVAHHFNNILGGVATFVDHALRSEDTTAMRRALEMTAEAASRVARITQSLLSFAEQGSPRNRDLVDLTEVVLTFVHLVERPLSQHNVELKLDLQPVPTVPVEAQRMHQVLNNLLSNAEEAMPEGGTIAISVERRGGNALLSFSDTGAGIAQQNLSQVFEPFFTTKGLLAGGEASNPGLGLSVVHGLILEMGGDISIESDPAEGTTFHISIPITEA